MKLPFLLLVVGFTSITYAKAQVKHKIAGIFSLQGVMETTSAFKFDEDSTFDFYFSYGALDRYGSGTWNRKGDSIVFSSKPFPGKDFKILDSGLLMNNYTTLKIKDPNPSFYHFVHCFFKTSRGDTLLDADDDGIIILPGNPDTINLLFELSPERISTFIINNSRYNSYTFSFEPWAVEVFFNRFALYYEQGSLVGNHPLLKNGRYLFKKEE